MAVGDGGRKLENPPQIFKEDFYTAWTRNAIARLYPKLAATHHFIIEPARNRWRLIVRIGADERVEYFETKGEANRARLELSDIKIPGLSVGGEL